MEMAHEEGEGEPGRVVLRQILTESLSYLGMEFWVSRSVFSLQESLYHGIACAEYKLRGAEKLLPFWSLAFDLEEALEELNAQKRRKTFEFALLLQVRGLRFSQFRDAVSDLGLQLWRELLLHPFPEFQPWGAELG